MNKENNSSGTRPLANRSHPNVIRPTQSRLRKPKLRPSGIPSLSPNPVTNKKRSITHGSKTSQYQQQPQKQLEQESGKPHQRHVKTMRSKTMRTNNPGPTKNSDLRTAKKARISIDGKAIATSPIASNSNENYNNSHLNNTATTTNAGGPSEESLDLLNSATDVSQALLDEKPRWKRYKHPTSRQLEQKCELQIGYIRDLRKAMAKQLETMKPVLETYAEETLTLSTKLMDIRRTSNVVRSKVQNLETQIEDLTSEVEARKQRERELTEDIAKVRSEELPHLQDEIATLREEKTTLTKKITNLNEKLMSLEEESNDIEKERQELENQNSELSKRLEHFSNEVVLQLKSEKETLNAELKSLQTQLIKKGEELAQGLSTFAQSQTFHQQRISELEQALKTKGKESEEDATRKDKLSQQVVEKEKEIAILESSLQTAQKDVSSLTQSVTTMEEQCSELTLQVTNLKTELGVVTGNLDRAKHAQALAAKECEMLQKANSVLETSLKEAHRQADCLRTELTTVREHLEKTEPSSSKEHLEAMTKMAVELESLRHVEKDAGQVHKKLKAAQAKIKKLESEIFQGEMQRRKMHDKIQELKGNVRVLVRVRPLKANTDSSEESVQCDKVHSTINVLEKIHKPDESSNSRSSAYDFSFDSVFDGTSSQSEVFDEVSTFVQSSLDGYNVCIFAFGQTGSGKTFTMQGVGEGDQRGIIPRSVEKILEQVAKLSQGGWSYKLEVSILELYNEKLKDLLANSKTKQTTKQSSTMSTKQSSSNSNHEDTATTSTSSNHNLTIRSNSTSIDVVNLSSHPVDSANEIYRLLRRANKTRSVARTNMNEHSSRSHLVFILRLKGTNAKRKIVTNGLLSLVDLAGSERLARSAVQGKHLKEAVHINKSLSCLVDVFTALKKKSGHIPYRNSKLTHLLQNCLSNKGRGKTLMMVNIAPEIDSRPETLCSLRFAKQANQTELGRAQASRATLQSHQSNPGTSTGTAMHHEKTKRKRYSQ
eukprot:g2262.t1